MDVAALVISVFAVVLSVVVAGWAIYLQWCMFKATTDQLSLIGKENASLGERIGASLGQLHETTTITRSRLDAAMDHLVSGLLEGVGASAKPTAVAEPAFGPEHDTWRVSQAVRILGKSRTTRAVVAYLAAGPRDAAAAKAEIAALVTGSEGAIEGVIPAAFGVISGLDVLRALDLIAFDLDKDTVWLTAEGRQVAARLAEETHD